MRAWKIGLGGKISLLGLAAALASATGCASSEGGTTKHDAGAKGGSGGSVTGSGGSVGSGGSSGGSVGTGGSGGGGSTGTGGIAGSGGTGGSGGDGGGTAGSGGSAGAGGDNDAGVDAYDGPPPPVFPSCQPVIADMANMLDFDTALTGMDTGTWGNYGLWGGGTYSYPDPSIVQGFPTMTWHITGTVSDYSGFGIYIWCKADASAYTGIQFDLKGRFSNVVADGGVASDGADGGADAGADGGAIPAAQLTFAVGNAPDDVDSAHAGALTWGTCKPVSNQFDGTCASPTKTVAVTAGGATYAIKWTDLTGGKPRATPDPAQITGISWTLPWGGANSKPYTIDLTIDNIKLMGGPSDGGVEQTASDAQAD